MRRIAVRRLIGVAFLTSLLTSSSFGVVSARGGQVDGSGEFVGFILDRNRMLVAYS